LYLIFSIFDSGDGIRRLQPAGSFKSILTNSVRNRWRGEKT